MLTIRLARTGKKHQPTYRIVVADSRKAVSSPYIEMIGQYDPKTKQIVLNQEKATDWMNKGAQPSNTVAKLLTKEKMDHKSIVVKKFRAISKKELEKQKAAEEIEKVKEQAEKEAAKEAFDAQVEAEKEENATIDPLLAAASEAIADIKEDEAEKVEEKIEAKELADETKTKETPTEEVKSEDKTA